MLELWWCNFQNFFSLSWDDSERTLSLGEIAISGWCWCLLGRDCFSGAVLGQQPGHRGQGTGQEGLWGVPRASAPEGPVGYQRQMGMLGLGEAGAGQTEVGKEMDILTRISIWGGHTEACAGSFCSTDQHFIFLSKTSWKSEWMKVRKATVSDGLKIFVLSVLGVYLAWLKLLEFWFLSEHSKLREFPLEFGEGEREQKGAAELSAKDETTHLHHLLFA